MNNQESLPKSEKEWKKKLTPNEYKILRKKATEPAFTGEYLNNKKQGIYLCAGCKNKLFSSDTKFDSGSGWPSFYKTLEKDSVETKTDNTFGMKRTEVLCSNCGGHLGHVFDDGPKTTGCRYCINSISLDFEPM